MRSTFVCQKYRILTVIFIDTLNIFSIEFCTLSLFELYCFNVTFINMKETRTDQILLAMNEMITLLNIIWPMNIITCSYHMFPIYQNDPFIISFVTENTFNKLVLCTQFMKQIHRLIFIADRTSLHWVCWISAKYKHSMWIVIYAFWAVTSASALHSIRKHTRSDQMRHVHRRHTHTPNHGRLSPVITNEFKNFYLLLPALWYDSTINSNNVHLGWSVQVCCITIWKRKLF